jgi:hypothetical protein
VGVVVNVNVPLEDEDPLDEELEDDDDPLDDDPLDDEELPDDDDPLDDDELLDEELVDVVVEVVATVGTAEPPPHAASVSRQSTTQARLPCSSIDCVIENIRPSASLYLDPRCAPLCK